MISVSCNYYFYYFMICELYKQKIVLEMNGEIPLFKKCKIRDPKNYRGISIVNTCYKMHSKFLMYNCRVT